MILKRTLKAFEGTDVNLETCIKEGYFFKINDIICLTCLDYETEKYYFETSSNIDIYDKNGKNTIDIGIYSNNITDFGI